MKESKDILTLFEALSNHEVFTPPRVANAMLDLLPRSVWKDPSIRLLDPCTKSGVFLREALFRFFNGLNGAGKHTGHDGVTYDLNDPQQRTNHILKNMLYGIAISELTSYVSRRTLYGVMHANTDKQIASLESFEQSSNFEKWSDQEKYDFVGRHTFNEYFDHKLFTTPEYKGFEREGNIFYPVDEVNKLVVEQGNYEVEDKYYPFIVDETKHKKILDIRSGKVKFDVIIGNPPYQMSDGGGTGSSAKPIYHMFISQAKELNPKYLSMVVPSRWFSGGKGLDGFRKDMLSDNRLRILVDFTDSRDIFPGVDIAGGINYFLWERDNRGECFIKNTHHSKESTSTRPLDEFDTFIRHGLSVQIIKKVLNRETEFLSTVVSSRKPFGLDSKDRPKKRGDLTLVWSGGTGPYPRDQVSHGVEMIDKWKVLLSKASYDHGGQPDKEGKRRIFSRIETLAPKHVCTESYLVAGVFDDENSAKHMVDYLRTKFSRFLVSTVLFTQNIAKDRFCFVPKLPMNKKWNDEELFKRYGLTEDEIEFIESMIRPM